MTVRAHFVLIFALCAVHTSRAQFDSEPLGDPAMPDIVVTLWTNSTTVSSVQWTEYNPATGNVTTPAPYPELLETPFLVNQVRSCSFAALDGDDQADWVLLV
ncbi:MAG: hypothetical protein IH987_17330, partial [Planctomycetes bacterium]|nr:hypothetical protein [Planctomycetota bacterium]